MNETRLKCIKCKRISYVDTTNRSFACPHCGGNVFTKIRETKVRHYLAR